MLEDQEKDDQMKCNWNGNYANHELGDDTSCGGGGDYLSKHLLLQHSLLSTVVYYV